MCYIYIYIYMYVVRGYPENLVENEMVNFKFSEYNIREKTGDPLVITCHPSLQNTGKIMNQ